MGQGSPVWLFHSLLADASSCLPLAEALASRHRVFLPHLPGFGNSPPAEMGLAEMVPAELGLAAVADSMAAAIQAAGAPVAIIGNGYGSFVALMVALRHPDCVTHLVLAGTGAAFDAAGRAAFRGMALAAGSKGLGAIADTAMRRLFSPAFQAANPDLLADRRARFVATDQAVFTAACDALAGLDIRSAVASLRVPTLVMVGSGDEATPPPMARELAALVPGARLVELPGLAHVPQLQDTAAFVAAMGAFLEQG